MSEKPPRRKKKEESPEPAPNPELERLIAQASKGNVPEAKQEIQPEQLGKRIISRENDVHLQSQLGKFNTLNFKPGFSPEELFNETPLTKETVSDTQLEMVLAKIAAEKRLTGAMFLNYLNDIGGKSASPEAVEKIMAVASKKLDKEVFEKLKTIVSSSHVNEPEIHKEKAILEPNQVDDNKVHDEVKSVEASKVPVNLPHGSEEELKKFEEGLIKSVEDWQKGRKDVEPPKSPQESTAEITDSNTAEDMSAPTERNLFEELTPENIYRAVKSRKLIEVKVKRSSGDVEDGWFVTGGDDKDIVVLKDIGGGKAITRIVSLEELNDLNKVGVSRVDKAEPVLAPRVVGAVSKEEPVLTSEGAFFTRARKESLARDFGVDASIVSHEEAPEGTLLTPEQKKYLSELDVPMPAEERGSTWKPTTRAEWKEELYSLIFGEKNSEGKRERIENLKANLAKRSEQLGEKAKEYGPVFVGYVGSKIEQYNKLKGWQKLAITGALMAGTAFSAGAPAIISTGFTAALWGQRLIGAIGMGMNKRKKLDAEIAANPEHRLAGKSEWEKNKRATLYAAGYMLATSGAVYLGVEGLKAAANSEWIHNPGEWVGNTREWLGHMRGYDSVHPDLPLTSEELEALAPSTDALENLAPIPDMPEGDFEPHNILNPEVDEHIAKAQAAIERMKQTAAGQAQVLNTMSDGSESSSSLGLSNSSAEVPLDQVHTVQTLDPALFAEAKGDGQLRILAENSLKHLTPNEQAVLDNHIASLTPRERYFFDQYSNDLSSKFSAPEVPLYDPEVDEHIAKAHEAIERMQKLVDEQAKILNSIPDGSESTSSDLPGPEESIPTPEQSSAVSDAELGRMPAYEGGHVGDTPLPSEEIKSLAEQYASRFKDSLTTEQINNLEKQVGNFSVDERIAFEKYQTEFTNRIHGGIPDANLVEAPHGLDPIDGHPMSELEEQKLSELQNAMHDPRETGAWPPGPSEEKGFFEKLFGGNQDTAGQFTIDSVSATEPHIYAHADGHLFAYGGSIEEKIETIQKFLTENPDKIVYGTDDSGNYRIPWSLYEGHALPGEPVRTGGFLGFFSSFMDAPKPEEFVKKIK